MRIVVAANPVRKSSWAAASTCARVDAAATARWLLS